MTYETMASLATAVVALATAIYQHFRITNGREQLKAEIQADAVKAAALLLADALVAAAKLKADANVPKP